MFFLTKYSCAIVFVTSAAHSDDCRSKKSATACGRGTKLQKYALKV